MCDKYNLFIYFKKEERKMKFLFSKKFNCLLILLTVAMYFSGCSSENTKQEAEKILDKQAQYQEQAKEGIETVVSAMEKTEESLINTGEELEGKNKELENKITELKGEKVKIDKEIQDVDRKENVLKEKAKALSERQKELKRDSLRKIKNDLNAEIENAKELSELNQAKIAELTRKKDSLANQQKYFAEKEEEIQDSLSTGIGFIDQRLNNLDHNLLLEKRKINLNEKKISLANEKILTFKKEINLLEEEKSDLIRDNASNEEIEQFNNQIGNVSRFIAREKKKITMANDAISKSQEWIASTDDLKRNLGSSIRDEYDKGKTLAEFIENEKKRLSNKESEMIGLSERIKSNNADLQEEIEELNNKVSKIDNKMELVKGEDISSILALQAALEEQEAELANEEADIYSEESKQDITGVTIEGTDSLNEGIREIDMLNNKFSELKSSLAKQQSEIAKARQSLAKKKAEVARKRAKSVKTISRTAIVVIVVAFLILVGFYFLGKKKKKLNK